MAHTLKINNTAGPVAAKAIFMSVFISLSLIMLSCGGALGAETAPKLAKPESVGISSESLADLRRFLQKKVDDGLLPGAVVLIARHGRVVMLDAIGYSDLESKTALKTDQIFRLGSMSKQIIAVAMMKLYQDGKFDMADPLSKYLPEFENLKVLGDLNGEGSLSQSPQPSMRDVLRHTAGFAYDFFCEYECMAFGDPALVYPNDLASFVKSISEYPLLYVPGEKWSYSVASDIQGRLIEVIGQKTLDKYLSEEIFEPLGMKDSGFFVQQNKQDRIGPVYKFDVSEGRLVRHPDSHVQYGMRDDQWITGAALLSGGGGLSATAQDYWRLIQTILDPAVIGVEKSFAPGTGQLMITDQIQTLRVEDGLTVHDKNILANATFGYGVGIWRGPEVTGQYPPAGTIYWGGGYGTRFWADPKNDLVAIFMTSTSPSQLVPDYESLFSLVYAALLD